MALGILFGVHGDTVRRAARALAPLLAAGSGGVCARLPAGERRVRLAAACRDLPDHGGRLQTLAFQSGLRPADGGSVVLPAAAAAAATPLTSRRFAGPVAAIGLTRPAYRTSSKSTF